MLDLVAVNSLITVEEHGSLAKAAEHLGYTPAALSHQLSKLSKQVGAPVITRAGRGATLTAVGRTLVYEGRILLAEIERITAETRASVGTLHGRMAFGGFGSGLRGLFAPALPILRDRAPHLTVTNVEEDPPELISHISAGRLDAALVFDWKDISNRLPATMTTTPVSFDPADIILRRDHRLAEASAIDIGDLVGDEWTSSHSLHVCHRWLIDAFSDFGVEPKIPYRAVEYDTQVEFVRHTGCVAIVPGLGRDALPEDVLAVPCADPTLGRTILLAHRKSMTDDPALRLLVDVFREIAGENALDDDGRRVDSAS